MIGPWTGRCHSWDLNHVCCGFYHWHQRTKEGRDSLVQEMKCGPPKLCPPESLAYGPESEKVGPFPVPCLPRPLSRRFMQPG